MVKIYFIKIYSKLVCVGRNKMKWKDRLKNVSDVLNLCDAMLSHLEMFSIKSKLRLWSMSVGIRLKTNKIEKYWIVV